MEENGIMVALAFVHSLRPSKIRVINNIQSLDCWRVAVTIDEENNIEAITQEVEIGGLLDSVDRAEEFINDLRRKES